MGSGDAETKFGNAATDAVNDAAKLGDFTADEENHREK